MVDAPRSSGASYTTTVADPQPGRTRLRHPRPHVARVGQHEGRFTSRCFFAVYGGYISAGSIRVLRVCTARRG